LLKLYIYNNDFVHIAGGDVNICEKKSFFCTKVQPLLIRDIKITSTRVLDSGSFYPNTTIHSRGCNM